MPCRALEAFGRACLPHPAHEAEFVLMPCRALEAFGPSVCEYPPDTVVACVLMPCRALEAFRRTGGQEGVYLIIRLNALSGIGGVQTYRRLDDY